MKYFLLVIILFYSCMSDHAQEVPNPKKVVKEKIEFKDGDIIFQTTHSKQCDAVQEATHSKFTHCGMLFKEKTGYYVLEAVQPVRKTPLNEWIEHGDGHYVVKRLQNFDKTITPEVVSKMHEQEAQLLGKDYDIYFGWSDETIYCSEMVWKIYERTTGLKVGKLQKLKDFDLTSDKVKAIMQERYGNDIPLNETVVSPKDVFDSELLVLVAEE